MDFGTTLRFVLDQIWIVIGVLNNTLFSIGSMRVSYFQIMIAFAFVSIFVTFFARRS